MLPFLKPRKDNDGVLVKYRQPDESVEKSPSESLHPALKAGADDILRALEQKDSKHLAMALQAFFDICDSMPHEEGPHTNESDDEQE